MRSYYALAAHIRYYGRLPESAEVENGHVVGVLGTQRANPTQWKEPPHERLANLPTYDTTVTPPALTTKPVSGLADPKTIQAFVRTHGIVWAKLRSDRFFDEDAVHFADAQEVLRKAWLGDAAALKEIEEQVEDAIEARVSVRAGDIEIATENLWSFLCVLFLWDYRAGKAKVCQNPDCPHPYFLEKRKDQRYCTHKCAVLINVRRFRERQDKRESQRKRRT